MEQGRRKLLIVESPNKIRTYKNILGKNFDVEASVGHYKMLDPKNLAVDIENHFEPNFQVDPDKKNVIKKILEQSIGKDIYIATDPDQEGYAIGKFLYDDILHQGKSNNIYKVEVRSITQRGISSALKKVMPFEKTNFKEFDAFLARRIGDRLIGYMLSPMLSNEFRAKHSAGRVQSPAVRLIVDREREIRKFKALDEKERVYYSMSLMIEDEEKNPLKIVLKLDDNNKIVEIDKIKEIANTIKQNKILPLEKIETKEVVGKAPRPYMSLTLLSDLSTKLGIAPEDGMKIAVQLFEKGYITYPRTDSERLDESFIDEIKDFINKTFQGIYEKRQFSTKSSQADAHEAVRHDHITDDFLKDIENLFSNEKDFNELHKKVYKLIAGTTFASQAKDAVFIQKEYIFYSSIFYNNKRVMFSSAIKIPKHKNYILIMEQIANIVHNYPLSFPSWEINKNYKILSIEISKKERNAPSRYTETTLLKKLKSLGIGRPSTYASILKTIKKRSYCTVKGKKKILEPTDRAFEVIEFLEKNFSWIIDYNFTKEMEKFLDDIVSGKQTWETFCDIVYGKLGKPKYDDIQFKLKPSKKQLEFAVMLSKTLKIELPDDYETDAKVLSIWIDSQKQTYKKLQNAKKPTQKQIDFAQKIAKEKNISIPEEALKTSSLLSKWIDKEKKSSTSSFSSSKKPTQKQIDFAQKIANEKNISIPEKNLKDSFLLSSWIKKNLAK